MIVELQKALKDAKPGKVLDVGTRFGEFAVRLKEVMPEGTTVIGIDNDAAAADKAREKFAELGLSFEQMDGARMTYPDNTFEVVALSNTLHHIREYDKVLAEMLRVLKPGGYFVLNEMYSDVKDPAQQVHVAQHTLEARIDCLTGGYQRATWKKDEIKEIFRKLPLHDVTFAEFEEEAKYNAKLEAKNQKLADAVEKIAGKPEYAALKQEALDIQARCRKEGIRRCVEFLCVGRK